MQDIEYISIGPDCFAANFLTFVKLRNHSSPFDWINTEHCYGLKMFIDCIETRFSYFCENLFKTNTDEINKNQEVEFIKLSLETPLGGLVQFDQFNKFLIGAVNGIFLFDFDKNKVTQERYQYSTFHHDDNILSDINIIKKYKRRKSRFLEKYNNKNCVFIYSPRIKDFKNIIMVESLIKDIEYIENNLFINKKHLLFILLRITDDNDINITLFDEYIKSKNIKNIFLLKHKSYEEKYGWNGLDESKNITMDEINSYINKYI